MESKSTQDNPLESKGSSYKESSNKNSPGAFNDKESAEKLKTYLLEYTYYVKSVTNNLGDVEAELNNKNVLEFFKKIKESESLQFNFLVSVTAIDWLDQKDERFTVVYHLMSLSKKYRLRIKINIPEADAIVDSLVPLWNSANFMEREVFDMYGIIFTSHPNLKKILMYDEFIGFPLRKDYPVQGKQPRINMLHPEVTNTARDMNRGNLVKINNRK